MNRRLFCKLLSLLGFVPPRFSPGSSIKQTSPSDVERLRQAFLNPPDSAKPHTWWHWTGGNVTLDGIRKDLEWMKRSGIAGCNLVDVSIGHGQVIENKALFGSPAWLNAFRFAAEECRRLGLEMGIDSSPGWSEAGGPWVRPEQAMKKIVWSELTVAGPQHFSGKLPHPPYNNGPIRDLEASRGFQPLGAPPPPLDQTYYADSVVLAFPTPSDEIPMTDCRVRITMSAKGIDPAPLLDGSLNTSITIPAGPDGTAWLQFEFPQPFIARAFTIASRQGIPVGRLLASLDGTRFSTVAVLPGPQGYHGAPVRTFAFPAVSARFFRLELTAAPLSPGAVIEGGPIQPARNYVLREAILHSGARVNRWEDKAVYGSLMDVYQLATTPDATGSAVIQRSHIIDLTSKMTDDGTLNWDVPAGKWTIIRIGYSLTGAKNRPELPAATGYEVDKLNPKYVEAYFRNYTMPFMKSLGSLFGTTLRYMTMDSWEAGMQNWTDNIINDFRSRRGYDPTPYLPILVGRVVENSVISDRFLWDFRRTLADMYADCYYGTMTNLLHEYGMKSYGEASGIALEIPEDTLLNKSKVDIPMAEFWVHPLHPESMYYVDVRQAASAAHVYGKPIVAAESFTGGGYEAPYTLKKIADYWFAQGVNRIVLHTSAHQPLDTKPGNMMVGTYFDRNITWAEMAKPFMTYLARASFMLQQGYFVADLAYLLKEGAPSTMPFWGAGLQPAVPKGYDFDCINTDILLHKMTVSEDGRLILPSGMSYRVLVLPETDYMRPEVLTRLHELVLQGATVVGPRPARSPSLVGYPQCDLEVQQLADKLWGDLDGVTKNRRTHGKGMVIWGLPLDQVLSSMGIPKDFDSSCPLDGDLLWLHRRTSDVDIYFVANHTDHAMDIEARFRVNGKKAELWHIDTGRVEPAGYTIEDGRTIVPLHLAEREALFVVFIYNGSNLLGKKQKYLKRRIAMLKGPWEVTFPPNLGAPARIRLEQLESWTNNSDPGVRYFSGTATYTNSVQISQAWLHPKARIVLDLGEVRDIAEITVNGKQFDLLWKPPYAVDVTDAVRAGRNKLEIKITNQWTNRIVGDQFVPPDKRVLPGDALSVFSSRSPNARQLPAARGFPPPRSPLFVPQAPLESGLLGPVTIVLMEPEK